MPDNINIVALPTLGDDGWVMSSFRQADILAAYFLASKKSESPLFKDDISSFAWLIAAYSSDPNRLSSETKSTLEKLFGRYFNSVMVEASTTAVNESTMRYNLHIYVEFKTADGSTFNLSQAVQIADSTFILINNAFK